MSKALKVLESAFNSYTLGSQIGQGGAGRVFEATDSSGEVVAIKILNPGKSNSEGLKRFKNEINFCLRTSHPNVIKVLDHGAEVGPHGKSPFYAMELLSTSLRTIIGKEHDPKKILSIYSMILDGVEAAHLKNVAHRDLKPENILLDSFGERLVIADFGIARFTQEDLYTLVETRPQQRLANFQYAAPEQRIRGGKVDHRADIYSLGFLLNELFTGTIPLGTGYTTIGSVVPDYEFLDPIVESMLRQNPSERPSSIDKLKQELFTSEKELFAQQKISNLSGQVIPEDELDDPLIAKPIQLVNFDWTDGKLTLFLSQSVNPTWEWAFQNMGSHSSVLGKGTSEFMFFGDTATITAHEGEVQQVINYLKDWLPLVNGKYKKQIRHEHKEKHENKLKVLRKKQDAEEARARLLKNVKI